MREFNYNKLLNKSWNLDILNLIAKIHEYKGKHNLLISQKTNELDRLVEIAKIQSVEYSNKIEGIVTTSMRLEQLFKEKTTPRTRNEDEIIGYRDVLNTIHENYEYIPMRPSYILQLHRDLLKHAGLSYGGRFKNVQNYINETRQDGTSLTRFTPVSPADTPEAVEKLCNAYELAVKIEKIDPLVLIPIFICDFLCIHPFNDGNGRMSRLLTLLLLYKNGYYVGKYISIEKEIEKNKDLYYEALKESDLNWHKEKNDYTPFIKYMLQIILSCYTAFEEKIELFATSKNAYEIVKKYINEKIGKFTGAEIIKDCPNLSRSSILAALKKLSEESFIIKKGSGKNTFYVRTDSI